MVLIPCYRCQDNKNIGYVDEDLNCKIIHRHRSNTQNETTIDSLLSGGIITLVNYLLIDLLQKQVDVDKFVH